MVHVEEVNMLLCRQKIKYNNHVTCIISAIINIYPLVVIHLISSWNIKQFDHH